MPLQCTTHTPKSTSTNWRWSNEIQLEMSFRTSAVRAAQLPWLRNFNGPAWNNIDSRLGLPWCTKSSVVSLTFHHTILQGLVAAVVIPWLYNKSVAEWSHMKPASFQQRWFHGIDSQPQQWLHLYFKAKMMEAVCS